MANMWARHPVYTAALFLTLLTTFYLLFAPGAPEPAAVIFPMRDNTLATRLKQAHYLYDKQLTQRAELIHKFGPDPKNISLYVFFAGEIPSS